MAGRDLFSDFKPKGHVNKNSFDLSQKHVFSMRPGIISPVASVPVVPGDYFDLNIAGMIRSMTMNTAAFVRGKWHFDSVFVPYSQLWHPFNQFITQRNDKHSSLQKGTAFVPVINLATLVRCVAAYVDALEQSSSLADAQANYPWAFDMFGYPLYGNIIRLLDMLGYGDFSWIYEEVPEEERLYPEEVRVNPNFVIVMLSKSFDTKYVNIFALAAYQHAWYDLYRNKFYDEQANINTQTTQFNSYVEFFNWDDIDCRAFSSSVIFPELNASTAWNSGLAVTYASYRRLQGLLSIRYHQWKKDRFTAMMPSAQFGSVSTYENTAYGPIMAQTVGEGTSSNAVHVGQASNPSGYAGQMFVTPSGSSNFKVTSVVDVMQLRKAELLQNWKQNALRAGNMTDDAMKAHYGEEPYYVADENVRFLGQTSSQFQVNPISATSSTGDQINGVVGDLAAQGKSDLGGHCFKDSFKDFGVIQIYMYFVPEAEYQSNMIEKEHTRHEMFDFFTKELENIGLQPELAAQLNMAVSAGTDPLSQPIGYNPPNIDYKTAVDKVHAGFADMLIQYSSSGGSGEIKKFGDLSAWVAPRPTDFFELTMAGSVLRPALKSLYINPNIFDKVFRAVIDGDMNTDNFVCNVFLQLRAIRNMSVLGIPQF